MNHPLRPLAAPSRGRHRRTGGAGSAVSAWRRLLVALRSSMSAQITLSITLVSVLLVASSNALVLRLTTQELRDGGELVMLANLAFLRDDLAKARFDVQRDRKSTRLNSSHR